MVPTTRNEFLRMLDPVDEVIELPARLNREEAFAAADDEVLERAKALLVIWDGQGAQGKGRHRRSCRPCPSPRHTDCLGSRWQSQAGHDGADLSWGGPGPCHVPELVADGNEGSGSTAPLPDSSECCRDLRPC